jgi:hypothetical protein
MSAAQRQKRVRQRQKEQGLVDIRVDAPLQLREALKERAKEHERTLKEEILEILEEAVA